MNEKEKLRVLIPHWIEHNQEHAEEFRQWAKELESEKKDILQAANLMNQVNDALRQALTALGGALEQDPNHHHHHH